jgi:hypothetical protein
MGKGQLLFKGDKPKKKKKRSKHSKTTTEEDEPNGAVAEASTPVVEPTPAPASKTKKAKKSAEDDTVAAPTVRKGTGTITTSGTVVTGHDTRFEKEVAAGDAILCNDELRVITMRLSNGSLNLSSTFSKSVKTPTAFQYISKPRNLAKERKDAQKLHQETQHEQQVHAFDLYNNESLVYREKTETGSYRVKREEVQGGNTRGDLLQMRAKRQSDKYC